MTITGQALDLADDVTAPEPAQAPGDPASAAVDTAHRLDDVQHHLSHAAGRMKAARAATDPGVRDRHSQHLAGHLDQALDAGHDLTAGIRAHYPAEAAELEQVKEAVGLARAVSEDAKAATTAHLLETTLHELTHAARHAQAMTQGTPDAEWEFNADHAAKHLDGAAEHAGKLEQHLRDNYPAEAGWLEGVGEATAGAGDDSGKQHAAYGKDSDGTITAQMANGDTITAQILELVGPKGYIHNWIFVGVPIVGDRVNHPRLGQGTVTGTGSGNGPDKYANHVIIRFDRTGYDHKFPVRRTPGVPGFKPQTGRDPAVKAVHNYTLKGAGFVEDTLGGQSAWNGTVTLWPKETHPGMAAFMHWDGTMSFQQDAAHGIARNADAGTPGPGLSGTFDMQVPLHELIHSVVPDGESYSDSKWAYQHPEVAAIEEGFTQLGTAYHAGEFFKIQGVDGRETAFAKAEGGYKTLGDLARERSDPAAIAAGKSWGSYPKETAAALAWTREVAKAEGLRNDLRSKAVQKRLRDLADEVNGASPKGKPAAMAKQMMRAMNVKDRPRKSGYDLSGEVAQIMSQKLADGSSMTDAAKAARDYLDVFTWNITSI